MQNILIHRIHRIDDLIQRKGTGNAVALAYRLGISRASLYGYLQLMKDMGSPIEYDPYKQTYYYSEEGNFTIAWKPDKSSYEE